MGKTRVLLLTARICEDEEGKCLPPLAAAVEGSCLAAGGVKSGAQHLSIVVNTKK